MKPFNKVAIIGTGLIGGSIGLALKKKGLADEIIGVSRRRKTLSQAKRCGAIDKGSQDLSSVKNADLVILAVPVKTIIELSKGLSGIVKKDCIVIDVGSTKKEIVSRLERLFPNYLGTHPLAGSQKSGVIYARSDMFKHSLCILTPTLKTKRRVIKKINRFWQILGAKTVLLSPEGHDRILSFVSHLPHLVAFSLIDFIPGSYLKFAASGLKDATRIASSEPGLWSDIFITNRTELLKSLKGFVKNLLRLEKYLTRKNKNGIYKMLTQAKQKRDSIA